MELGPAAKDVCRLGFEAEEKEVEEVGEKAVELDKEGELQHQIRMYIHTCLGLSCDSNADKLYICYHAKSKNPLLFQL